MENSQKQKETKVTRASAKLMALLEKEGVKSIADKLGVKPSLVYNWKTRSAPTMESLERIAQIKHIDWNSIFYDEYAGDLQKATTLPSDAEMVNRIQELEKRVKELESLEAENASLKGEVKVYEKMMNGFIQFPRPLSDDEVEKKRKSGNFKKAPEGARIMHLNFNRNTNKYQPSEVIISEVGFIPMWKREQNASRA